MYLSSCRLGTMTRTFWDGGRLVFVFVFVFGVEPEHAYKLWQLDPPLASLNQFAGCSNQCWRLGWQGRFGTGVGSVIEPGCSEHCICILFVFVFVCLLCCWALPILVRDLYFRLNIFPYGIFQYLSSFSRFCHFGHYPSRPNNLTFPTIAQNNVWFCLLPCTSIYWCVWPSKEKSKKVKDKNLNWNWNVSKLLSK